MKTTGTESRTETDLLAAAKAAWDAIDNLLDLRRERKADTGDAHEAIIEAHGLLGAAIAKATGNSQNVPTPAPGTDATTADGRFVSGSGYGGERM